MYSDVMVRKIAERAMRKYHLDCDIDDLIQDVYLSKLEGKKAFRLTKDEIRKYQAFEPYDEQLDNRRYNVDEDRLCVVLDVQNTMQSYRSSSERRVEVLHRRINNEETLEEIAKDFGVCRDRIRQLEAKELRNVGAHFVRNGINRGYYVEDYE